MKTNWFWNKSRRIALRHANRKMRAGYEIRVGLDFQAFRSEYCYRDSNRNDTGRAGVQTRVWLQGLENK
jgi:hypothetical protein